MRLKTPLRLDIEEFLADESNDREDWLCIPCRTSRMRGKISSMVYNMKLNGYTFGITEYDKQNNAFWISRRLDTSESSKKM